MTPAQKIKSIILEYINASNDGTAPPITVDNVDGLYDEANEDEVQEAKCEIREGQVETDLPCDYSRHYESKSVAAKASDGSWVGWTYWYGGGKHGEPEAIDWIEDAYNLNCAEEEKMVIVRTFTKIDAAGEQE